MGYETFYECTAKDYICPFLQCFIILYIKRKLELGNSKFSSSLYHTKNQVSYIDYLANTTTTQGTQATV